MAAFVTPELIQFGEVTIPVKYVRHPKARRYVLRVSRDGSARLTLPRSGSKLEAFRFAQRQLDWIQAQYLKQRAAAGAAGVDGRARWQHGSEFLFRGERKTIAVREDGTIRFAGEVVALRGEESDLPNQENCCGRGRPHSEGVEKDLRPQIEAHLRALATGELTRRTRELAAAHEVQISNVTIRNQKSRWGSCSARGNISLNWRLIQTPPFVSDYIIVHELMHRREMNHSRRFWKQIAVAFPRFREAENWLRKHSALLR